MISQVLRDTGAPLAAPQSCFWVEHLPGLQAHTCSDVGIILWKDEDHNVWLPSERPPAKWAQYIKHMTASGLLGAAADASLPGVCRPHKPVPLTKVRRLQTALRGLASRVHDNALLVAVDGLIGAHTVKATNRAMVTYVLQPGELATGNLTHAQISAFAPQLTAYIQKAPHAAQSSAPAAASTAPPGYTLAPSYNPSAPSSSYPQPQGAPMPAYNEVEYYPPPPQQQQVAYYPPPTYYGPTRAPGGLPAGHASIDVKAFVPAQYEHIRISPTTGMLLVGVGFLAVILVTNKKKEKG